MQIWSHWSTPTLAVGSNQVGCRCAWPRFLPRETNTGATKEIPALHQSWRGCDHPTSNWSYQGHQVSYLVPRTTGCLSLLWSNIEHWPYASGVCSITGMSWRILHSWPLEYPLWDNSWDMHCGILTRSGIILCDMNGQIFYTIHHLNHPWSDGICQLQLALRPGQCNKAWAICLENASNSETHLHV